MFQDSKDQTELSRTLSRLLRHGGVRLSTDGFAILDHVLRHDSIRRKWTLKQIEDIVRSDHTSGFTLRENDTTKRLEIRASLITDPDEQLQLSKTLSWVLRHGAQRLNIPICSDGFIPVNRVLRLDSFKGKWTLKDIEDVIRSDPISRFTLRQNDTTGELEIRANHGHSLTTLNDLELTPITSASELSNKWVVFGTKYSSLPRIMDQGIIGGKNKVHIHLSEYENGDPRQVSRGQQWKPPILVYIDVDKALADGIKFYRTPNNLVVSEGNSLGFIEPKYFMKIIDNSTGANLLCGDREDDTTCVED